MFFHSMFVCMILERDNEHVRTNLIKWDFVLNLHIFAIAISMVVFPITLTAQTFLIRKRVPFSCTVSRSSSFISRVVSSSLVNCNHSYISLMLSIFSILPCSSWVRETTYYCRLVFSKRKLERRIVIVMLEHYLYISFEFE